MELSPQKVTHLGFLTIAESDGGEIRGGYLLTTEYGRPVEFHYSHPLRFTKQERVLYGSQFGPLVHAELVAKPLTDRQTVAPRAIISDRSTLLFLRRHVPAPVVWLQREQKNASEHFHAETHSEFPNDLLAFEKLRDLVPKNFDWLEPFDRIVAALQTIPETSLRIAA